MPLSGAMPVMGQASGPSMVTTPALASVMSMPEVVGWMKPLVVLALSVMEPTPAGLIGALMTRLALVKLDRTRFGVLMRSSSASVSPSTFGGPVLSSTPPRLRRVTEVLVWSLTELPAAALEM